MFEVDARLVERASDQGVEVVFDGALANRDSLAAGAATDADAVLAAYAQHGESVAALLTGSFALALWDASSRCLLLVRDRTGRTPLFYAHSGDLLVASTSLDRVLETPGVSGAVNVGMLGSWLGGSAPTLEETPFSAVRRLPGGHELALVGGGTPVVRRYWAPTGVGGATIAEALAEVTARLLGRYGPAAIHLSGGLDSAAVAVAAAAASRSLGAPLPLALSVVARGDTEEPTQRAVAADLGLPQRWLRLEPDEVDLRASLDLVARLPFLALGLVAGQFTALDAEAVSDGRRLLLDGEGGDEWLGAAPSLGVELLTSGDLVGLWWLISARSAYRQRPRRQALRELAGVVRRASRGQSKRSAVALAVLDHPSTAVTAEVVDGLGRYLGATYTSPLWDAEVVEAAVGTRARGFVTDGRYKAPVLEFVTTALPSVGRDWPPPVTLGNFATATFAAHLQGIWEEREGGRLLAALNVPNAPTAGQSAASLDSQRVWCILCCESWMRLRLGARQLNAAMP